MPTLKNVLVQQAGVPMGLEAKLPAMAPKVSTIMSSIAQAMPDLQLPDIPITAPGGGATPTLPSGFPDLIKGLEGILPGAAPSSIPVQTLSATALRSRRIMGGGYRSM